MLDNPPPPPAGYAARVPCVAEASLAALTDAGPDYLGREALLTPATAAAWHAMRAAAVADGIELLLVSAFRSIARQTELLCGKLERGMSIEDALQYSAYPGFSEHHSGEAIDIGTPFSEPLEEEFETTAAFSWLCDNAAAFGFHMSYPRENSAGIAYEPWHWRRIA
ncbi:MAG: M15 family metallopeptidase [Verrucomicrobiota bacterium]